MPQPHNRSPWTALAVLAFAMLIIGLDTMVLTVALPTLARDLDASTTELQWITTSYPLALGAFMIPFGALGDRLGRGRLLALALIGFGASSALCAFATTPELLIGGRVALGICAAAAMPMSMAVLPDLFPDTTERNRALGIWMASSAAGMPLGPILGGFLLQHFWWGSVFLINVPIAAIAAVAVWFLIPNTRSRTTARFDVFGAALSIVGFGALVAAFTQAGESGWTSAQFAALLAAAAVTMGIFIRHELRTPTPLVRLTLFARRGFLAGTVLASATMVLLASVTFQLAQVFSVAFDADALGVGLRLLPVVLGLIVGTRISGRAVQRFNARAVAMASIALLGASSAVQAVSADGGTVTYLVITVLLGVGLGSILPLAMGMAMNDLDVNDAGSGSALLQSTRQISAALGVAVFGSVVATVYSGRLHDVELPAALRDVASGNVVAVTEQLRHTAPGVVPGVVSAYEHGIAVAGVLGVGFAAILMVLCLLIPAQSNRGEQPATEPSRTETPNAEQSEGNAEDRSARTP
ncbi:MFS transporter [Gordonia sp. CPCC 205333]|uniref:MFS transporter n=1 Tax=Gordonia sp. CPCC 205333 TaxID=3140790 RepID=UPI003AF3FF81